MTHELRPKSPDQRDKTNIPISTLPIDTCAERDVVVETHTTRERSSQQNTGAQDQNLKTKRLYQGSKGKLLTAKRTNMEGKHSTITVRLRNQELWEMFHREQTEMIITKAGRRMFPVPDFFLGGLEPDQYYGCAVEVVAADMNRYRYKTPQGWVPAGKGMQLDEVHCKYLHPNSASLGQHWMAQGALFDKLKLSNHIIPSSDSVVVSSMQKYELRLVVTKLGMHQSDRWVFNFPDTQFITVTSYQNPRMTQLKIDNNPFAKAFREGKRSSRRNSTGSKSKKRRLRFPSPPPIIRYQTPFMNFLNSQDQPAPTAALVPPPPPPPPLSHNWPEDPCTIRNIPFKNDFPFPWEQDDLIPGQISSIPSTNSNLKVELNRTLHLRESLSFGPHDLPTEDIQPQFPTQCWSAPPLGFNIFEDAQTQMQHYTSRDQIWRES